MSELLSCMQCGAKMPCPYMGREWEHEAVETEPGVWEDWVYHRPCDVETFHPFPAPTGGE